MIDLCSFHYPFIYALFLHIMVKLLVNIPDNFFYLDMHADRLPSYLLVHAAAACFPQH